MQQHPIGSLNWDRAFTLYFDMKNGGSAQRTPLQRRLSDMKDMFYDKAALSSMLETQDPLVYEFYDLGAPEDAGDLAFGTSIVYPGKIGNEFFMTKGHYHSVLSTAEVYYCLSGSGAMLMENPEGQWSIEEMNPGTALYVPKRYAHRSINTGQEPLITFFVFRADAGHDYGTIETKGYRKLLVDIKGKAAAIDNPKYL